MKCAESHVFNLIIKEVWKKQFARMIKQREILTRDS